MLLTHNADINVKNNEGLKPKDLVTDSSVKKLIQGIKQIQFSKIKIKIIWNLKIQSCREYRANKFTKIILRSGFKQRHRDNK